MGKISNPLEHLPFIGTANGCRHQVRITLTNLGFLSHGCSCDADSCCVQVASSAAYCRLQRSRCDNSRRTFYCCPTYTIFLFEQTKMREIWLEFGHDAFTSEARKSQMVVEERGGQRGTSLVRLSTHALLRHSRRVRLPRTFWRPSSRPCSFTMMHNPQ